MVSMAARVDGVLIGMMSVFTLVAAFVGGMNVAMDTVAGERERQSLLPLLMNRVRRREIVLGKWLAGGLLSFRSVCGRHERRHGHRSRRTGTPVVAAFADEPGPPAGDRVGEMAGGRSAFVRRLDPQSGGLRDRVRQRGNAPACVRAASFAGRDGRYLAAGAAGGLAPTADLHGLPRREGSPDLPLDAGLPAHGPWHVSGFFPGGGARVVRPS